MGNLQGIFGFGANPFLPLKGIISSYVTSRTLDSPMYEQYFPNLISVHYCVGSYHSALVSHQI
jgi:hypothetical protein